MAQKKDSLIIAGKSYQSRLLVGTGKYKDFQETRLAIDASGAEIITVAIRRTNIGQNEGEPSLLDFVPPNRFTYLPNTAGCYSADDAGRHPTQSRRPKSGAVRTLYLAGDPPIGAELGHYSLCKCSMCLKHKLSASSAATHATNRSAHQFKQKHLCATNARSCKVPTAAQYVPRRKHLVFRARV